MSYGLTNVYNLTSETVCCIPYAAILQTKRLNVGCWIFVSRTTTHRPLISIVYLGMFSFWLIRKEFVSNVFVTAFDWFNKYDVPLLPFRFHSINKFFSFCVFIYFHFFHLSLILVHFPVMENGGIDLILMPNLYDREIEL